MTLTASYIISQIFVVINYLLNIISYQFKSRKTILILNLISLFMLAIAYYLLSAYTGMAMAAVGIIRNAIFFIDEFDKNKSSKIKSKNIIELIFLTIILLILTVYTYDGFFSLMSVFATYLYTISIWQKNTKVYKILGIPVGITGVIYNIYICSIMGIILESFSLISAIIGFVQEVISHKYKKPYS